MPTADGSESPEPKGRKPRVLAIVGRIGCGKTTLLRLIVGVEKLDFGHIYIHGRCVDDVGPSRRGVRMVFQEHGLWPHMRVFHKEMAGNVSSGIRLRKQLPRSMEETTHLIAGRLSIAKTISKKTGSIIDRSEAGGRYRSGFNHHPKNPIAG
jgi:ABC-type sugar transport system ATPase subunit